MMFAAAAGDYHWAMDLSIWSGVVFVLLAAILVMFLVPAIGDAMRRREQSIVESVRQAEIAAAEIEEIRARQRAERKRMMEEAAELIREARRDADRIRGDMLARAQAEADRAVHRIERETALATETAMHELWDSAAELSVDYARRILETQLDASDQTRLIDDSIAEIGRLAEAGK